MFTGIIEGVGKVVQSKGNRGHRLLEIEAPFSLKGTALGESIAVDGCCLTVTQLKGKVFSADLSPETLSRTSLDGLKAGSPVNLERALKVGDRLGGHWVQGHVDAVGTVVERRLNRSSGANKEVYLFLTIALPRELRRYVIEKGSIAVDGVSLTVNSIENNNISLCLIPHTQGKTALTAKQVGARVNLEVDVLLKYINNLIKPAYLTETVKVNSKRKRSLK